MPLKLYNKLKKEDPSSEDEELWNSFREGSKKSFIRIYDLHVNLLYSYGIKIHKDEVLIKDCIQELFIDLLKRHNSLGPTTSIKFYLLKSLRRKIYRASKARLEISIEELDLDEVQFSSPSWEVSLIKNQDEAEKNSILLEKINLLPKRQKEAIFLRYFDELSYDEIASVMSISKSSVYILITRSIDSLQKLFFLFFILFLR